jgi:hypothetical protein
MSTLAQLPPFLFPPTLNLNWLGQVICNPFFFPVFNFAYHPLNSQNLGPCIIPPLPPSPLLFALSLSYTHTLHACSLSSSKRCPSHLSSSLSFMSLSVSFGTVLTLSPLCSVSLIYKSGVHRFCFPLCRFFFSPFLAKSFLFCAAHRFSNPVWWMKTFSFYYVERQRQKWRGRLFFTLYIVKRKSRLFISFSSHCTLFFPGNVKSESATRVCPLRN